MTTAEKYMDYAPRSTDGADRPTTRLGSWFRAQVAAYVATHEGAYGVPVRSQSTDIIAR